MHLVFFCSQGLPHDNEVYDQLRLESTIMSTIVHNGFLIISYHPSQLIEQQLSAQLSILRGCFLDVAVPVESDVHCFPRRDCPRQRDQVINGRFAVLHEPLEDDERQCLHD